MADDFSRQIARVVASQIAEATGFDACQDSAIEVLGDLLLRYLSTLCSSSHSYAELAGRSQSNLSDLLLALEDLGVSPEELHQHMQLQGTDVPFAHTLAQYPVHRQQALPPTFAERKEPCPDHIPPFLPALPDPHTYQQTAAYAGHQTDPHKQRQSMLEAKQKSEAALHKLHQRISSNKAAAGGGGSSSNQPDSNPFLVPPTVEQLPLQLPALPGAAAAAAVAAAAAAAGGGGGENGGGAAAGGGTANGHAGSSSQQQATAAGADGGPQGSSSHQQQQQLLPLPLPSLQQQQAAFAAGGVRAAAAADGDDGMLDEEDLLFESAAVLKAFSSILPPDLLAQHTERLQGGGGGQHQQQQDVDEDGDGAGVGVNRKQQGRRRQRANGGLDDLGEELLIDEEGPSDAMDVDGSGGGGGAGAGGGSGTRGGDDGFLQNWLTWDDKRPQEQQGPGGQQQQQPAELLGPAGAAGPELLRFAIDPLAASKATALRLAGRSRPPDAFAERSAAAGAAGGGAGGVSGSGRQRRSKYDVDPTKQRAEGILAANPESLYATAADGRQQMMPVLDAFADLDDNA